MLLRGAPVYLRITDLISDCVFQAFNLTRPEQMVGMCLFRNPAANS